MILLGLSDIGKVRSNNEDNFACGTLENAAYAMVCDGMGGAKNGEIASQIAIDTIKNQFDNAYSPKMSSRAIKNMLEAAINAANAKIYDYAISNDSVGMGTTAVAAFIKGGVAHIAFDGDSRAYLINDDITQLTTDHTFLQRLFELNKITKEQMESDSRKHIITRALGVEKSIEVDYAEIDIDNNDMLLLCSDGLTNCISDEEILRIIKSSEPEAICQALVDNANKNGGVDNITVAIISGEVE